MATPATAPAPTASGPVVVQWVFDTRPWWPDAVKTKDLETHAARALALLTEDERKNVLRYYHIRDAKMSLGSALLKHMVIAKFARVPWWDTTITRDERTKPIYQDPATGEIPVAFNVSHQAGLVALIAVHGYQGSGPVEVGIDVVCTSERRDRDHKVVFSDGWGTFVDMHSSVFSPSEVHYLKNEVVIREASRLRGVSTPEDFTDYRLRCFYTLWCLREAYVKLTGEALLADWLEELEFRNFRPPDPTADFSVPAREDVNEAPGGRQVIRDQEIVFKGQRVDDANMVMRSLGPDFMICAVVRTPAKKEDGLSWHLGPFHRLSLEEILSFAESTI
ncbi:phosphopantetheinyl transferase [Thozetella sp. PMI_491]|nr:phosphopantetheinyl transferase [Thozetella sp. PMI_491]